MKNLVRLCLYSWLFLAWTAASLLAGAAMFALALVAALEAQGMHVAGPALAAMAAHIGRLP